MKNTTKYLGYFAAIFLFLNAANVSASNIAVLDADEIIKNSKAMSYVQKEVSKKQKEYQKVIDKRQSDLEEENKKIESKKSVMSEEAFNKEQEQFAKKVSDLRNFVDEKQNNLKKASVESISKINDEIQKILTDIRKEKNLDLIVSASQTFYYKEEMDISAEVLKRLNDKVTKVTVKF